MATAEGWRSIPLPFLIVLALGSGALWGLVFRSHPDAFLPWVALAPLFVAFELRGRRRAVLLASLHGLGAWLASIYWIAPTLEIYGGLPGWTSVALLGLVCVYLGLYHGAFIGLGAGLWRRGGLPALFTLPALWVALEVVRAWLFSGFPWNLAGYAWVEVEGALPLSAWIGALGLSYLVVLVNTGLALLLLERRFEPAALALLFSLLLLALGARRGQMIESEVESIAPVALGAPVRLIQPDTEILIQYDPVVAGRNYNNLLELSHANCDASQPLLLWPESAAWPFVYERDARLRADLRALTAAGCSVLLNSPRTEDGKVYNGALLLVPDDVVSDGIAGRYAKNHLVPYGEYVPLGELLPFVGHLARNAAQFTPGDSLDPLPWRGEKLGLSICFEVIFSAQVAAEVAAGATVLVTITNDAWYGDTAAPWQHLRAARFRAAENGRPLLRAAITGVSAVIEPDGSLRESLGVGEEGVLSTRVAGRSERTPFTRAPWLVPAAAVLVSLFAIWFYARERRAS